MLSSLTNFGSKLNDVAAKLKTSALAAAASVLLFFPAVAASTPATLIKQKSLMMGHTEMLYSKEGVRLEMPDQKKLLLMRPPLWQVQWCNTANKLYWEGEAIVFKNDFITSTSMFRPGDPSCTKPTTSTETKLNGLACKRFQLVGQNFGSGRAPHSWQRLSVRDGGLWMQPAPYLPANNCRVLCKLFGAPVLPGVPLSMVVYNNNNTESKEFKILEVSTKTPSRADFTLPPGYKKVAKQGDVNNFAASNDNFAEIFK